MIRIDTLHPEKGKKGVNIELVKYDQIREAILMVLDEQGSCGFNELTEEVAAHLGSSFDGSIPWYVTTVKLDLEARKEIQCNRVSKKQVISPA